MAVRILCIGDVVGRPGRHVLMEQLPKLISAKRIDLVVCNAENSAGGSGMTPQIFEKLLTWGVDVITMGDHIYRKKELQSLLQQSDRIVRPANLATDAIGRRWTVVQTKCQMHSVAVCCLLGQLYMGNNNSPWQTVDRVFSEIPSDVKIRVVDFHAEASSEKIAMGWHLNGRASAIFGTHTHIPTADARVLDRGTAYISDVGMTGPYDSVLGRRKDRVLKYLTTSMPQFFEIAMGDPRLCGMLATIEPSTGRATEVERIEICGSVPPGKPYDADDGRPGKPSSDD